MRIRMGTQTLGGFVERLRREGNETEDGSGKHTDGAMGWNGTDFWSWSWILT